MKMIKSTDRCSTVTHRLLGFARRMEIEYTDLNVNDVLQEVISFLEKEALHRNIKINFQKNLFLLLDSALLRLLVFSSILFLF